MYRAFSRLASVRLSERSSTGLILTFARDGPVANPQALSLPRTFH